MRTTERAVLVLTLLSLAASCSTGAPLAEPEHLRSERAFELDGGAAFTGVAVDPSGDVYVIDGLGELRRVDAAGIHPVFSASGGATDLVALEEGVFALTRTDMGFLLDLEAGTLEQHFCYLPDDMVRDEPPPETPGPTNEVSHALAFDPVAGLLYANPQTVAADGTAEELFSEVAVFDRATGRELRFLSLEDPTFTAGGMLSLGGEELLYGEGSIVYRGTFSRADREPLVDLSSYGIRSIAGMARDVDTDTLYVVSGTTLYAIDLAALLEG